MTAKDLIERNRPMRPPRSAPCPYGYGKHCHCDDHAEQKRDARARWYYRQTLPHARAFIYSTLNYHCHTHQEQLCTWGMQERNKKVLRFAFRQLVRRGVIDEDAGDGICVPLNLNQRRML